MRSTPPLVISEPFPWWIETSLDVSAITLYKTDQEISHYFGQVQQLCCTFTYIQQLAIRKFGSLLYVLPTCDWTTNCQCKRKKKLKEFSNNEWSSFVSVSTNLPINYHHHHHRHHHHHEHIYYRSALILVSFLSIYLFNI